MKKSSDLKRHRPLFIIHRVNSVAGLKCLPESFGVEIDLRDQRRNLILNHDPFITEGEDFRKYLKHYQHSFLILNIKSERIEFEVLRHIKRHRIKDYFFLDCSFPMILALIRKGERNIAVRFSEMEGLDTVLSLKKKARWVWVDCFSRLPLNRRIFSRLKDAGFKICLVSPELHGRREEIEIYRDYLARHSILVDAICAKEQAVPLWLNW